MPKADALLERLVTFQPASRGKVIVCKVTRGYSLFRTSLHDLPRIAR